MRYLGYQENQVRGTFGFPIQLYYVDYNHSQYEMPFHWHMECELILVLDGVFHLSVNGNNYDLKKGESAFIPGEFIHGGTPDNCIYECIVFQMENFLQQSPQCIEKYNRALEQGKIFETVFKDNSYPAKIVDAVFESMEKENDYYTFTTTGLLWQLVGAILEISSDRTDSVDTAFLKKNKQIKNVLSKIRNEYSQKLTLDELAAEAKLNPQYFCKAFREVTGKTPIDYLNYYRIECVAEQLAIRDLSVTDIALSCGFNDLSYFNRMFKRQKHMTPTAYRKKISVS